VISGNAFRYSFDKRTGMPVSMVFGGEELLDEPMDFNFWRAPADNDMFVVDKWKKQRLDLTRTRAYEVSCQCSRDSAEIHAKQSAGAMSVQPAVRMDTVWKINSSGAISMKVDAVKDPQIRTLPRIGIRLLVKKWLKTVSYYGMGPMESYVDKHQAARHDSFTAAIGELHEPYIRPQENGSHYDCDYVSVRGKGLCLHIISADENTFSFNASRFTQEELGNKAHDHELEACGSTVLCIDHRMSGLGSASCGPEIQKAYRIDKDSYSFAFMIIPENLNRQM
jgi:beta-galactosidase